MLTLKRQFLPRRGVSLSFAIPRLVLDAQALAGNACSCAFILWLALCACLMVTVAATGINIYKALVPRTQVGFLAQNRFAWPSLAALSEAPKPVSEVESLNEAWMQTITLAGIAKDKYRHFKTALRLFGGYLFFLVLLVFLAALL